MAIRVTKCMEVIVTIDDIRQMIAESLRDPSDNSGLYRLLNQCAHVLDAVTDEQIDILSYAERSAVSRFLSKAAERFSPD